jgi:hypothetical protein
MDASKSARPAFTLLSHCVVGGQPPPCGLLQCTCMVMYAVCDVQQIHLTEFRGLTLSYSECGGGGLYESMVMPTVAQMDQSRPVWPSCPAPGWKSGVHTLNSLPDNTTLMTGDGGARRPAPFPFPMEAHGPYTAFMKQNVEGIVMPKAQPQPTINGVNDPTATPAWTGPGEEGWYRSEFGCVSWSSFESMSATLPRDQWGMLSPAGTHRNWNPSNIINVFFGAAAMAAMSEIGEIPFKRQLYQSMVGQALFLKTEIEGWRAQNVFGTTIWSVCGVPLSSFIPCAAFSHRIRSRARWCMTGLGFMMYGSCSHVLHGDVIG